VILENIVDKLTKVSYDVENEASRLKDSVKEKDRT
jgi:hypothetical protein